MLFKGLVTREDEEQQTDSRNVREDKRSLLKQGYVENMACLGTRTPHMQQTLK